MQGTLSIEEIRRTPKVDLHCHLDGSVSAETLYSIGREEGLLTAEDSLEQLRNRITVPAHCTNLSEYLQCFGNILPLLQTKHSLRLAAVDVLRQAAQENTVYIELRFAPQYFCAKGLTMREATLAVLEGMQLGKAEFGIEAGAILCVIRGEEQQAEELLALCRELAPLGVCGLDLAGNEAAYPTAEYVDFFARALGQGVPVTLHAGECGNAQNVADAVQAGVRRIGHGIAIAGCPPIVQLCKEKAVVLETCPVSNVQTCAVPDIAAHPFWHMHQQGLAVTVNTDNRTVSGTSLCREWGALAEAFPALGQRDMLAAGKTALQAAFLSPQAKQNLLNQYFA